MNSNQPSPDPGSISTSANNQGEMNKPAKWMTDTVIVNGAPMTIIFPAQEEEGVN